MQSAAANRLKWILMTALALIWGSSFILMKKGLEVYHPDQVASIRMFASSLCLLPFVIRHTKAVKKEQWKFIALSGLTGNCIPAFLFATAQMKVASGTAGMLNSLTPVFTLIIGYFIFRTQVTFSKVLGVLTGLTGAAGLIWAGNDDLFSNVSAMALLIVLATALYAVSVNIIRHKLSDINSISLSGFALLFVGPPTGIYLFTTDFSERLVTVPGAGMALFYILILGLLGTAFSLVLFNQLIKLSGAIFASSVTYLIPLVALLWGVFDGEPLSGVHLIALGLILAGVYLINLKPRKKTTS